MFRRKKSLGGARRDLHQLLDWEGREEAMDWWVAAEGEMKTEAMSGPAAFLAMTLAMALVADDDMRVAAGLNIVIRGGYALRTTLPAITSRAARLDVSSLDREAIADLAARPVDPETGLFSADDAVTAGSVLRPSVDLVGEYGGDAFERIASVDANFWKGTVAVGTYQLHKNVGRIDEELIEALLRYGFALRAWEEALGITPGAASAPVADEPAQHPIDPSGLQPDGTVLDADAWVKDAAIVCTHPYEQFTELLLELSTIELLGIQTVVDRYMTEPWQGYDPAVEAGVSHARFGYALRNRETQLIDCYGIVREGDPLVELAAERAENSGIKTAVVHRLLRDVLTYYDLELLYRCTPGTTFEARRDGIEYWEKTYGQRGLDAGMTNGLIEHGYFLHRLFEVNAAYRDW